MKTKDQILWEEKRLLEKLLKDRPLLSFETDMVIQTVCVNYLITDHEHRRQFAIIKSDNRYEKRILEDAGIKTLQTPNINIHMVDFLIDYIFRPQNF